MKALFTGILICLLSVGAFAAEGRDVTYQSGAETVHALLYMPRPATVPSLPWSSFTSGGD